MPYFDPKHKKSGPEGFVIDDVMWDCWTTTIEIIEGYRSGRLVAVSPTTTAQTEWLCSCDCGGSKRVLACALRLQEVKSCGCMGRRHRHGGKGTRTYLIWKHMRDRCSNPKNRSWKNYGGRGIKVCEMWADFERFVKDMGEAPPSLTLERSNVDGDYEPQNCVWATRTEQARNKRNNLLIEFRGQTKPLSEWADLSPVSRQLVRTRFLRYGWDFERALLTPALFSPKKKPSTP